MLLTEANLPALERLHRRETPGAWIGATQTERDPLFTLREGLAEFNEQLAEAEALFVERVYENDNFSPLDARNHHFVLHYFVFRAGLLATHLAALNRPRETTAYVAFLDQEIRRLENILHDWHGDPEAADDIPHSFKEAMQEANDGRTVALEEDMFSSDAAKAEL